VTDPFGRTIRDPHRERQDDLPADCEGTGVRDPPAGRRSFRPLALERLYEATVDTGQEWRGGGRLGTEEAEHRVTPEER
jgi:hypothetical protein